MNKKIIFHLLLIGFVSNAGAMDQAKDILGLNTYPCEFAGQSVKQGTIALRAREKSAAHKNIDQFSYDVKTNKATLKFKDESVVLEGAGLDGFMDYLSKLSHYSDVSVKTTIGNNSLNWQFSGGEYPRNAVALYSMNKCKQGISSLNGALSGVIIVKKSNAATGTLSCTSNPYLPGSRLRLTSDKNDKQSVLIHRDFVQLLYNACKATAKYNEEKETSTEAKQVQVKGLFPTPSPRDIIQQPNDTEQVSLQLLEKDLPVMEQWLYAQKVKKYMAIGFAALLLAAGSVGAYFYSTSNAQ